MRGSKTARVGRLFDFLVEHPERVTIEQIMEGIGSTHSSAKDAVRDLRLLLEDEDTITLVCDPDPEQHKGRWLYGLVGTIDQARAWQTNRLRDAESRLETQHAVAKALVNGTDGRSRDGRRARLIAKALGRLLEDLRDFNADDNPNDTRRSA